MRPMPEPFKNLLNRDVIAAIGGQLAAHAPGFDRAAFEAAAGAGLEALELKARAAQITRALEAYLPQDFAAACDAMLAALHPETGVSALPSDGRGLRGWAVMPLSEYVAARGLGDFDRSMRVLGQMTKRFSAEFAVRPFLRADPNRALGFLMQWAADPDPSLRRVASEGSRPRLPWGIRLEAFIADPAPLVLLLTRLRDDPSGIVRRSVANSLNDIAKDHPDLVAALARDWLRDAPPQRVQLVRHACRTLVKRGHAPTLAALGFGAAAVEANLTVRTPVVRFGEALVFRLDLRGAAAQRLVIDYAIHHRKANGGTTAKVFKWRVVELAEGAALSLERRHPIRAITTRRYCDGAHRVEALVNGRPVAAAAFELTGA
jgi:3-methyladenine DNA glycosylase AlkC